MQAIPFFRYSFILSEINYKTLLYKKNKKAYNSFIIYLIKEGKKTENKDKKNITRKKIINYVLNNHVTSKAGIAKELNLSMPTVLANVNDLLEKRVLEETGEYASTGGRKAKSIGINKSYCHAMGILRSEERRVGKECRSRWSPYH